MVDELKSEWNEFEKELTKFEVSLRVKLVRLKMFTH